MISHRKTYMQRATRLFLYGYDRKKIATILKRKRETVNSYLFESGFDINEQRVVFHTEIKSLFNDGLTCPEIAKKTGVGVCDVRNSCNMQFDNKLVRDRFALELKKRPESIRYLVSKYGLERHDIERLIDD